MEEIQKMFNEAIKFHQTGKLNEAKELYEKILKINPNHSDALHLLGLIFNSLNQKDKAVEFITKAISILKYEVYYFNLATVFQEQNKIEEAIDMYEKAISINPNYEKAYYNLGRAFQEQNKLHKAITMYEKAISINFNYYGAYNNLSILYRAQNRLDEAIVMHEKAIAINPNYAEAHYWNKSLIYLSKGDLKEGFELYECRWQQDVSLLKRNFTQPLWLGKDSLNGKTILVHSEQGLGDTLQFCRYIPMVVKLNVKVIFEVEKPLLPLLKQIEGVVEFIIKGETLPSFDYHCPLLSLPHAFNTTLETIPPVLSNIKISEDKINYWKEKLKNISKPKIGLVWNGNPEHKNDHNRSLSLDKLINFLPKEFEYISLQKEIRTEDKSVLENSNISFFGNELNDFEDTSALIQNVDLVVSVDTSVAHLAGTLNKKTFVLLPFSPDWRWMLNRDDSPWYPSVKLFRQKEIANWDSVLKELNDSINSFFML